MKLACDKKYISLEDVENQLIDLRHLLNLHFNYFMWSKEYVEEHPFAIIHGYKQHNALVSAIIDLVDNTQEWLSIAQENYIQKPYD